MSRFDGKVVLVTGASSGLGAACVAKFASEGAQVYGVSRDLAKLEAMAAEVEGKVDAVSSGGERPFCDEH